MSIGFVDLKKQLPLLGVGLGLRRSIAQDIQTHADSIDWVEFVPENFMGVGGRAQQLLEAAAHRFPLISHGVNLSLGGTDELNKDYLATLKHILDRLNCSWWSDHLCFTGAGGTYLHDLLPLPFTRQVVSHVAERIKRAQEHVQRPLLIENISYYMTYTDSEMTEAQFLAEVLESADCGLLLDVNNLYVNSVNMNFDPYEFLDDIPLDRVTQIHIAGHRVGEKVIIDTHGAPIVEPVYDLLRYVWARTDTKAVLLERDQNFPDFAEIIAELDKIRSIIGCTKHNGTNGMVGKEVDHVDYSVV